jgi:hypothetical protein
MNADWLAEIQTVYHFLRQKLFLWNSSEVPDNSRIETYKFYEGCNNLLLKRIEVS